MVPSSPLDLPRPTAAIPTLRRPRRVPTPSESELDGTALELRILDRGWEIGLRKDLVWVATGTRFFFADSRNRAPHEALAEAYRNALDWKE